MRAFARLFLSFSVCVFDCWIGPVRLSASALALCVPGSTNSYWSSVSASCIYRVWELVGTYIPKYNTALLVHLGLIVVVHVELGEENLVFVGGISPLDYSKLEILTVNVVPVLALSVFSASVASIPPSCMRAQKVVL